MICQGCTCIDGTDAFQINLCIPIIWAFSYYWDWPQNIFLSLSIPFIYLLSIVGLLAVKSQPQAHLQFWTYLGLLCLRCNFSNTFLYFCIRVSNTCRWPSCHPSATAPTVWGLLGLLCLLWGLVMGPLSWPTRPDRTRLVIGQTRLQSRGK